MAVDAQTVIHALRMKRIRQAADDLEVALREGQDVSERLLVASALLERSIDPRHLRASAADIERLLEITRRIEAGQAGTAAPDPRRPRRLPV